MMYVTINFKKQYFNGDYKYLITKGATSWTAFRTETGFYQFLKIIGGELKIDRTELNQFGEGFSTGKIDRKVIDTYYYAKDELPQGVKECVLLSNANYNKAYYLIEEDKTTIYRLNPNCETYQKNTSLEYKFFEKIYG